MNTSMQIEELGSLLSDIIIKTTGDRDGSTIDRIERSLVRHIVSRWNEVATRAITRALRKIDGRSQSAVTAKEAAAVVSTLTSTFNQFEKKVSRRIEIDTKRIYVANKRRFRNRFQVSQLQQFLLFDGRILKYENIGDKLGLTIVKQDGEEPLVALRFGTTDRTTVENLVRLKLLAIGDHFSKNQKPQIEAIMREGVLERGLPKRQAGEFLRTELTRRLGGTLAAVPPKIRRQGQDAALNYFEGLTATTLTRARNFGQLNLLSEAGLTQFRWSSINDNRTSQICSAMDGRIFTVEMGKGQMNAILSKSSSDDLIEDFPWRKDLSEFNLGRGDRVNSLEVSSALAQSGVPIVPPAHFRCRSEIIPA